MVQSNQWIPPSPIKWHTLSREEQSRYYEMARQQRQLHMQLYPNWTMRDSVASGAARKRRNKRDKAADGGRNSINKPTQTNPHRNIESKYSQQQQTTTTTTLTPISIFFCFVLKLKSSESFELRARDWWFTQPSLDVVGGWVGGWERGAGRRFDRVVSSAVARCRQIRSNTTHAPTHFTSPPSRFRLPSVSFRFKIVRIDRISIYFWSNKFSFCTLEMKIIGIRIEVGRLSIHWLWLLFCIIHSPPPHSAPCPPCSLSKRYFCPCVMIIEHQYVNIIQRIGRWRRLLGYSFLDSDFSVFFPVLIWLLFIIILSLSLSLSPLFLFLSVSLSLFLWFYYHFSWFHFLLLSGVFFSLLISFQFQIG